MRNKWEKVKAKVKLVLMVDDDDDQAPSEQDIEDALKILVSRKPELLEDSEGYNRTFRELRNELVPKIDEGITLTDQNSAWKPWLSDMQSSDTWETPRSDSYYQYLVMDKNSSYSTLDYTANEIVKLLADPRRDQPAVSRKGLILGDVQSGKTRTYIALMNKAADCGYRLIIVLTSDNENLRQQTQERIDTDFIGWQDGIRVGIGKYQQNIAHPSQLTNENDFVAAYDKAFHSFPRPTWNSAAPCVAVIKKNASILSKFNKWFDSPEFDKDLPVLIIDDESDYASVNSAKLDDSPTRINSLIRDLCQISSRTSYVAVTATPFANIFIDDADESDLFPQDFIINGKPQMHISPHDAGSYNTAGASWKSNMTPSARPQIAGQSALDESSCMAHTRMPTDLAERMPTSRSSNTVQSVGSIPSLDAASRYTSGLSLPISPASSTLTTSSK